MIPREEIDRLNSQPIEAVAERLGLEVFRHKSLCPFHDDSRPSLTFNTYRNRYRCFVCDAHGGVIDLVMHVRKCTFKEACAFLGYASIASSSLASSPHSAERSAASEFCGASVTQQKVSKASPFMAKYPPRPLDLEWLNSLVRFKSINESARRFLFDERHIDPRVVEWCGLTSISQPTPCWRYGKPFYDAPSLLIPYYDEDGRLLSVQGRYLGQTGVPKETKPSAVSHGESGSLDRPNDSDAIGPCGSSDERDVQGRYLGSSGQNGSIGQNSTTGQTPLAPTTYHLPPNEPPRFRFPRGSNCHIYGLQILKTLQPGDELWITEGCSDCWAMLSAGKKAIAIPSATLLKDSDLCALHSAICNLNVSFHMYPDQDEPGEKLFLALRDKFPQIVRHQLPTGFKDFGAYWAQQFNRSTI